MSPSATLKQLQIVRPRASDSLDLLQPYLTDTDRLREREIVLSKRRLLHFESKHQALLSRKEFAKRVAVSFGAASVFVTVSLLGGMIGYHCLENLSWIDAFANASMILSGMGPLDPPKTWGGKLFAGLYALYSGLAVILAAGILFTPVVHRLLHKFHLEDEQEK